MNLSDTIAAISTPRGKGGVAMIRISGDEAILVADRVFRARSGKSLADTDSRRAVWGDILACEPDGSRLVVDDGIATVFRAPASFTGEDTVELCCHGGALITQTVLEAVLCAGARPAEAGEFTRRAFVAGRIGLTEAEALATLLEAKTAEQLRLSRGGMEGRLSREAGEIYAELLRVVSDIYARVDFPEEDLAGLSAAEIRGALDAVHGRLLKLSATYRTGKAINEGIRTVICGRTNSGKSSLYNRIVGEESAIVTDIEGTTRDVLESCVSFGGVTLNLVDTAGLRESDDVVEKIGIDRARREVERAELILAVFDISRQPTPDELELCSELERGEAKVIPIFNKSDIADGGAGGLPQWVVGSAIRISAKTGEGIDSLSDKIRQIFLDGELDLNRDAIVSNARQYAALRGAAEFVQNALDALDAGLPEDLCGSDIERAMSAVSELDGRAVSADIVGEIFSHFCVGK